MNRTFSRWAQDRLERLAWLSGAQSWLRGLFLLALGGFAVAAPLFIGEWSIRIIGLVLIGAGLYDLGRLIVRGQKVRQEPNFFLNLGLSLVVGVLLYLGPKQVFVVLMWVVSGAVVSYGLVRVWSGFGDPTVKYRAWTIFNGAVTIACGLLLWTLRSTLGFGAAGVATGLYCLALGWSIVFSPDEGQETVEVARAGNHHADEALGLKPHPVLGETRAEAIVQEVTRRPIDVYWIATLVITFFAIHLERMGSEWTLLGLAGPLFATAGDLVATLLLSAVLILPARLLWRRLSRPLERRVWNRFLCSEEEVGERGIGDKLVHWWLKGRMRFAVRMRLGRGSLQSGLWDMLEQGLPVMALLVAVNPIWGFSWYFNSENWASGFYQKVAESRLDGWREGMIKAVTEAYGDQDIESAKLFEVKPAGVANATDFSFVVIGDSGEGDPSQWVLHDQLLAVSKKPEVKFFVISSDVVYPDGAMKDYEFKVYLPYKGVTQPIYAIPGNHDWFTGIQAFNANFLEARAARAANRGRTELGRLSDAMGRKIDDEIRLVETLRREYNLATGQQRAPFFEIHTAGFSLVAGDTGIMRRFDDVQMKWFESALERSKGTYTMVLLGHPIYALGAYQAEAPDFHAIHQLLRKYRVPLVMAGDTHDFEYYREPGRDSTPEMHHFVNGGGGAYLSIGAAMDWPLEAPISDYALYPSRDALATKLNAETPGWKWPVWWWVDRWKGRPAGVEVLSGVFDFNHAPFYQSFVEVKVEGSAQRVRLIVHGVHGPLKWADLQVGGTVLPAGAQAQDPVEFVFSMQP